jgi:hypothetical protein
VKAAIRRIVARLRAKLLSPVLGRVDQAEARTELRLDFLARRLDEIEALVESALARSDTVSERSTRVTESQSRLARRLDEIERLMGSPAGDH